MILTRSSRVTQRKDKVDVEPRIRYRGEDATCKAGNGGEVEGAG